METWLWLWAVLRSRAAQQGLCGGSVKHKYFCYTSSMKKINLKSNVWLLVVAIAAIVALIIALLVQWQRPVSFTNPLNEAQQGSTGSLQIKEWGVTLKLQPTISDAYYTFDQSNNEAYITTKQLEKLTNQVESCRAGMHGLYYKTGDNGGLPLQEQQKIELACMPPETDTTAKIGSLKAEIRTAVTTAKAD